MAKIKLPPNLYARPGETRDGRKRTLYYVRFVDQNKIDPKTKKPKRRSIAVGDILSVAKKKRDEIMSQYYNGFDFDAQAKRDVLFKDWMTHWLKLVEHKRSYRREKYTSKLLNDVFAQRTLSSIGTSDIEAYKTRRQNDRTRNKKPPANATINRELAMLKSMLILAERDGLIFRRPHFALLPENNERHRIATEEEYNAIRAALPEHMQPVWMLARETAMRISEITNLQWDQVDLDERLLTINRWQNKEKKAKLIPLNAAALAIFRALPLPHEGKVFSFSYDAFSHQLRDKAMPSLGIKGLWLHDLRGTFITQKINEQWDRKLIKLITGHRTDKAFDRYVRPTMETLREVVEKRQPHGNANFPLSQPFPADDI